MVGGAFSPSGRRNSGFFNGTTEPAVLARSACRRSASGAPLAASRAGRGLVPAPRASTCTIKEGPAPQLPTPTRCPDLRRRQHAGPL